MRSPAVLRQAGHASFRASVCVCVVSCDQWKCLKWSSTPPTVRYGLLSVSGIRETSNQLTFIVNSVRCMVKMPLVMEWSGDGLGSSQCMMNSILVGHIWSMTIWCVLSMKKLVRTGGSQFLCFPWIFHNCHRSVLYKIVTDRLRYQKLCSRWVPKMLTEEHKTERASSALSFFTWYSEQGDEFLDQIVTGDETCVSRMTPASNQQSMEWRHTASPRKKKFKQTMSTCKIMCTVFWDRKESYSSIFTSWWNH